MELTLENSIAEISRLCDAIELFCDQEQLSPRVRHDMLLVLDELVTNVITHGFSTGVGECVRVCLEKTEKGIYVAIIDDAPAFNPLAVKEPDVNASIEDRPIGGLGIHLMKQFSQHLAYQRKEEHNVLTFYLKAQ
ncbi:MAG: ATP-binding protein [Holosporales bacterium]|jgi:anti-sigma regulatory factor (Ser/Thr protein kinase)|nr:ATP-binding protein [Holosporales bacterium]